MQNRIEAKLSKYAIKNLSLILVICYAIGYLLELIAPNLMFYLYLNPYEIIYRYQIWRLFTWILIPPDRFNFFTLIVLYFYYSIGTSLEYTWGTYRYNVYLFSGFIFTVVGAFLLYAYTCVNGTFMLWNASGIGASIYAMMFTTYYVNMSIFLAYAATFPDAQVFLFMILPIRVKYLGIVYGAILVYEFLQYLKAGTLYIAASVAMFVSLLNFIIFFATSKNKVRKSRNNSMRFSSKSYSGKGNTTSNIVRPREQVTRHKCAQCGATEVTNPEYSFRFCSKCNGNYEYCEKHIFTHIHVE